MVNWQRIMYYLGLALVEATPAALLLTIAGADAWGVLIGIVLLGALADWIVLRRLPPERQTLALAAGGLLCALWVVKGQVVGDYGLLGDWGQALGAIFSTSHPRSGIAYLSLLLSLYCFWRGTRLTMHDRVSVQRVFRAIAFSLLLIVGIGLFGARLTGEQGRSSFDRSVGLFRDRPAHDCARQRHGRAGDRAATAGLAWHADRRRGDWRRAWAGGAAGRTVWSRHRADHTHAVAGAGRDYRADHCAADLVDRHAPGSRVEGDQPGSLAATACPAAADYD